MKTTTILIPLSVLATTLGAVAGYSLHAPPPGNVPASACSTTGTPPARNSEAAPLHLQEPSPTDSSWKRWPVTDF